VLHVVHDYFPAVGGSELLFQKIGEGLARRGVEIVVFTSTARTTGDFIRSHADTLAAGTENVNGVNVRRFRYRQFAPWARRSLDVASHVWSTNHWPGYGRLKALWVGPHLPGLVRQIVDLSPHLIAATAAPFLPLYKAAQAARRVDVPFVVMPCLHPGDRWLIDNPALLNLLPTADAVMALTPHEMLFLRALEVPADRIRLIGAGVAADAAATAERGLRAKFGIPGDEPIVLFCGRKEEGKGVQHVLEAMVRLWQRGIRAMVVLAGGSTDYSRTYLTRLIGRLPAEWRRRVVIRDDISEAEKWGWYCECDVLAHPSHIESFGIVYLEAWLCGKPVVGGRTGPQMSLIDEGRDGLLVRFGDVEELAMQIGRLLTEPGLAVVLGRAGREKVLQHYTWETIVDRAAELYLSLARGHEHAKNHGDHRHA